MTRKILVVLGILAIMMVGCAYAADSADSLNNNTVTISGLNFTIPDGLAENVEEAVINETDSDDGYKYVSNSRTFEDDEHVLVIGVSTFEQNMTDDYLKGLGEVTTINNVTGQLDDMGFMSIFSYVQGDKVVVLTADSKDIIEEALI